MRRHLVGELAQVVEADAADLLVVVLVGSDGDRLVGEVRQLHERLVEFRFELVGAGFELLELLFEFARAVDGFLRLLVFALLFQLADLLADLVALVAEVVALGLQRAPLVVHVEDAVDVHVLHVSGGERVANSLRFVAE